MRLGLPSRDVVDVRLVAAVEAGGCAICEVRSRAETGMLATIIAERVLDIGFREGLERDHGFCRRHAVGLLAADREASGILGTSILYGAMLRRRSAALRAAMGVGGRRRRSRLRAAAQRPRCLVCDQGARAVETASARLGERCADPAWAEAIGTIPFCLDDLSAFLAVGAGAAESGPGTKAFEMVADRLLARLEDLRERLDAYAHNSAADRRHLLTDDQRSAADAAARVLGD